MTVKTTKATRTAKVTTTPAVVEAPALISPREYVADFRARLAIHNKEFAALVRDVRDAGTRFHETLDTVVAEVKPVLAPVIARVRN